MKPTSYLILSLCIFTLPLGAQEVDQEALEQRLFQPRDPAHTEVKTRSATRNLTGTRSDNSSGLTDTREVVTRSIVVSSRGGILGGKELQEKIEVTSGPRAEPHPQEKVVGLAIPAEKLVSAELTTVEVEVYADSKAVFPILFMQNLTTINLDDDPHALGNIEKLAQLLKKYPKSRLLLDGQTCDLGATEYNLRLGLGRAESIRFLLEARYRICLLYTSPSPRDLSTSRMPSSA